MIWDYRYLHMLDDGKYLFYVSGIKYADLFSYQLIAHALELNLLSITSAYMALLHAYRALFGPAYRESQLALDIIKTHYKIKGRSLSADSIARLIHIHPNITIDVDKEKVSLLTMIGLYYQGKK